MSPGRLERGCLTADNRFDLTYMVAQHVLATLRMRQVILKRMRRSSTATRRHARSTIHPSSNPHFRHETPGSRRHTSQPRQGRQHRATLHPPLSASDQRQGLAGSGSRAKHRCGGIGRGGHFCRGWLSAPPGFGNKARRSLDRAARWGRDLCWRRVPIQCAEWRP